MAHPHALFVHQTFTHAIGISFHDDFEHKTQGAVRFTFDQLGRATVEQDPTGLGTHCLTFEPYRTTFSEILSLAVSGGYSIQLSFAGAFESPVTFLLTKNTDD